MRVLQSAGEPVFIEIFHEIFCCTATCQARHPRV